MKNYIAILLGLALLHALPAGSETTDSVEVLFRQSHTVIDPDFGGNRARLDSIINKITPDSTGYAKKVLRHVHVTGAASPEGSVSFNRYLSEKRASAIFDLFRNKGLVSDSDLSYTYLGRDWEGLREMVRSDENIPGREQVSEILDRSLPVSTPRQSDRLLTSLKELNGGVPYRYLYNNIFPSLRFSRLTVEYEDLFPKISLNFGNPADMSDELVPPALLPPEQLYVPAFGTAKKCRPFYMGLKTNMLYDAALLPNIGAEFYVGKGWSVTADWMYGWWDRNSTHYYWRAYGGTVGVRKWFGKKAAEKPLTGHHIGLFAGAVTYDFELGGTGIMGGLPRKTLWDRCNFISGIEYGYSLPVARRLNIDFTIGVGYMGGKYLKYEPRDGYYVWQSTHKLHWVGPTKAEISLVWLIGCDNYNRRKGSSSMKGGLR